MYLWNKYRRWLVKKSKFAHSGEYRKLLTLMHEIPFRVVIPRDRNREGDGRSLRPYFFQQAGMLYDDPEVTFEYRGASVLEVLVAFSSRIDREYIGLPGEPHPEIIFEDMLRNLGLLVYDDAHFSEEDVIRILDQWMLRDITYDGRNGLFPLSNPKVDQRNEELWRQMTAYLSENY